VSASSAGRVELVGEVAAVVYTDDRSGFGVVELHNVEGDRTGARATGPLARLSAGQPVALHGRWSVHPRYGETFVADYFTPAAPRTAAGLERFLAGDHFPGIGARLASSLVTAFGLDLPDVITKNPSALTKAEGITERLADVIVDGWRDAGVLAHVVTRLAQVGVGASPARWLVAQFADQALEQLDEDPYVLLGAPGLQWTTVDRLARAQQVAADDERRLIAAAVWSLRDRRRQRGDVAVAGDELVDAIARLLGADPELAARALACAVEVGEADRWTPDPSAPAIYALPADAWAEEEIAQAVVRLDTEVSPLPLDDEQIVNADPELTGEQRRAVHMTFAGAISVLTGGPGTGKTRTVAAILQCAAKLDQRVALCAPTGRAAKRLEELSGHRATTIHRLLDARPDPDNDDRFVFGYDDHQRLPHDLVIADEWSMADLPLAHALITALPDGGRLLMVGDVDQLPPVGPGAVLRDLLAVAGDEGEGERQPAGGRGSGAPVAATTLNTVHRQAAASRIITLAHELKAGTTQTPRGRDGDVFAVPQHTSGVAERIAEIVAVRAPSFFECEPADVQVLAPRYGGPAGVDRLNEVLRERLNPRAARAEVLGFCEGDRVVQTRNNVDLDIANGEVGEVAAIDAEDRMLEIAFPTGIVRFDANAARDLRPAWCLTVHKSQGGQWPVVVLVLDPTHRRMLWRELVYTAVTRAVRGLLLVGTPHLLVTAAERSGSGTAQRSTSLAGRLRAAITT
jgi:exodeoxyribonuclease V alpha subunit